ncbi:hypothetical protein C0583_00170 [Candidatus Parcubacteria bacterium]|nr:MAG: hypothetical protein C0583_00170 [Candidatus Parcubacteria bacterium]
MANKNILSRVFLLGVLALVLFACFSIFKSFIGEFLIATILVTTFYGFYEKVVKLFRGKRMLASLAVCLLIIILIIGPLANMVAYSAQRLVNAYSKTEIYFNHDNLEMMVEKMVESPILANVLFFIDNKNEMKIYLLDKIDILRDWLLSGAMNDVLIANSTSILAGTANTLASVVIVIFCMFFFFIDGEKMLDKIKYWTPLPNKYDKALFQKFRDVSYSTLFATFVTGIAQGVIGAIGFLIVGFPIFFASIAMAFASIIPYVGTALVWVPVSIFLLVTGQIWQGVFMLIWGTVVIGNSDNILRAYLIKDKAEVHPLFVFFSIIGGLSLFGFWGIVYGPLIISLAVTVMHIYELEYKDVLEK